MAWVTPVVMVETERIKVPVLMYHSISPEYDLIPAPGQSVRPEIFAAHLRILEEHGYTTHTLSELCAHLTGEIPLTGKPVVITFDDGYLDNYVFAFPLLERFGMKATIFVSEDFIDHAQEPRARVHGKSDPQAGAYLSWPEMREMVESGLVEIESHGKTHDLLPRTDRVVDYHRPGVRNPWLAWRLFPSEKWKWFRRKESELGYGYPVFESGPALEAPAFVPDEGLVRRLVQCVEDGGGHDFFDRDGWRRELDGIVDDYRMECGGSIGHKEAEEDWRERVRRDLIDSRIRLSRGLGREVRFLAWPHDAYNAEIKTIALEEAGYRATSGGIHQNEPGADARGFSRIPAGEGLLGRRWRTVDLWLFQAQLRLFRGNHFYYPPAFFANRIRGLVHRVAPPG